MPEWCCVKTGFGVALHLAAHRGKLRMKMRALKREAWNLLWLAISRRSNLYWQQWLDKFRPLPF
jgi:hypothetical protein